MNSLQKSFAKPPLITPSASPPSLFSHVTSRASVVAPPLKRQRVASTPRASHHTSSSSTSRPQSPPDVHLEREASKLRLLDVWSNLAERYTKRLDEDDIVNIRTYEITQDRGFIRNSRKFDFGAIAAPVSEADEGEDEEDEDDIDELDAFADTVSEMDNAEQSEMGFVPPVTALDPADAEDLRAFLEAERTRKQLCGSEVEEDDYSAPDIQSQGSEVLNESAADFEDQDASLLNDTIDTSKTYIYVDSSSEDELDNWDITESSVVCPITKREDNDNDIQIIDGPTLSSLKSAQAHQEQLHTPPLSHSSSVLSATASKEHFVFVSSDPSPPLSPPPIQNVPSGVSPKHSRITTDVGNTSGPYLDLTQILKVKKSARNDSTPDSSPNKRISTNNVRTPRFKPYVLLTPRKFSDLAKPKTKKQNFCLDEGQELDVFKDNPRAVKNGKVKAKVDESFETTITTKATTSEDGEDFATRKVKKKLNSSKSGEDPLTVVPFQIGSPPRIDKGRSSSMSPLKPHSINNRNDETLGDDSRSPRPSGSFSGGTTLSVLKRQSSIPRKRKRVSSDSGTVFAAGTSVMSREKKPERSLTLRRTSFSDDLPYHENQASTSNMISEKKVVKPKLTRRSSSRSRRSRLTPKSSLSSSESESGSSSDGGRGHSRKLACSHRNNFQFPHPHPYPYHAQSYTPSPHRKQQRHPPPPMPDPRAQFIITQAMQQLSTLVGIPWTSSHDSSSVPYTPSRRPKRVNSIFNTPSYQPHPYPYSYDPNLSLATLPPESPELRPSPEQSSYGPWKSSMARSRSRRRRVSFKLDDNDSDDSDGGRDRVDPCSSPSNIPSSRRGTVREQKRNTTKPSEGNGKARAETPISESSSESPSDCGNDRNGKSCSRGQTPGPPKGRKCG